MKEHTTDTKAPPIVKKVMALYDRLGIEYEIHHLEPGAKNCYDAAEHRSEAIGEAVGPHQEIKTLLYYQGKDSGDLLAFNLPGNYDLPLVTHIDKKTKEPRTGIDFKKLREITGAPDPRKVKTGFVIGQFCPLSIAIRTKEGREEARDDNFGSLGAEKIKILLDETMLMNHEPLYATLGDITWGAKFPKPEQLLKLKELESMPEFKDIVTVVIAPFAEQKKQEPAVGLPITLPQRDKSL